MVGRAVLCAPINWQTQSGAHGSDAPYLATRTRHRGLRDALY
jgi:hypothetical protein